MIEIRNFFTQEDAIRLLERRGLVVLERPLIRHDGRRAIVYKQWQVMNPFTGKWESVEDAFRRIMERVSGDLLIERLMKTDLNLLFI